MHTLPAYRRRSWPVVGVFVCIVAFQVLVAAVSIDLLSAVRGYVSGESLYSKGQKDAQIFLIDYAEHQREEDYRRFRNALAVPLGDRAAREELQKQEPDLAIARKGFIDGGNHPDDVAGLIRLFRWFHDIPFMSQAIATWTEGDEVIQQMSELVERAHERLAKGEFASLAFSEMRTRAPLLNDRLTLLESRFSAQLGEASRRTEKLLLGVNLILALLLALTGLGFVRHSSRVQALTEREGDLRMATLLEERQARAALEASSRAKTEFLSRMSHELRTPLNAVLGFAQLLRLDAVRPPSLEQLERIQHIENAGSHLLALVNDVLDLSRVESGQMTVLMEAVDLHRVLADALGMVSSLATEVSVDLSISKDSKGPKTPEVEADAGPGEAGENASLWVLADPVRLRQVLVNLLSNAIKYNRRGGSVVVSWTLTPQGCRLSISDTGLGMTPQKLDRLFEPFNRLGAETSNVEGTGIGLVLSRRLMELMNGELIIDSVVGQGTVATIVLKPSDTVGAPVAAAVPRSEHDEGSSLNVLYAEDDEVNAELVRQVAKLREGVQLRVAVSGTAALTMARLNPPDLMLIDMNLGDMTGTELVRALRAHPSAGGTRMVALSADALPEQITAAITAGFDGYLTKPIDFRELLDVFDEDRTSAVR